MKVHKNGKFIRGDTELQCYTVYSNSNNKHWSVDVITETGEIESIRCWYWLNKDKTWAKQQLISINPGPTWDKLQRVINNYQQ